MRRTSYASLFLLGCCAIAPAANADPILLGIGTLAGSAAGPNVDLSGLTAPMENGLPGNILGGLGSGLTYAGGNTFLGLPDRGPNATPYNPAVDDTTSYISRFQTLNMTLTPSGSGLPFTVTPTLTGTTLLSSPTALNYGTGAGLGNKIDGVTPIGSGAPAQNTASKFYFTGRSDNFVAGNSGNPSNARLDPESIRVAPDGKSVFVSDEYGPYVRQFDRTSGQLVKTFTLPTNLDVAKLSPMGANEMSPTNASGRVANKGMEGLAITPDGKTLVGIMQAALIQDGKGMLRIVTIDIASGQTTHEYAYQLTTGSGVSDIVAINDHQFLVDERDGQGKGGDPVTTPLIKQQFMIDLNGAKDVSGIASLKKNNGDGAAVTKSAAPLVDLVALLNAAGIPSDEIPSKIEGITFGQDVTYHGQIEHTLWIANDNDFTPDASGPNKFFVIGLSDSDLPGLVQEQVAAIPEPATWAMMLIGFAGLGFAGYRQARRRYSLA
jgi:hypothetical protein